MHNNYVILLVHNNCVILLCWYLLLLMEIFARYLCISVILLYFLLFFDLRDK